MALMTTSAPASDSLEAWTNLRDWAANELEMRRDDAVLEVPRYSRNRDEAQAALRAAEKALQPFIAMF